jgi:hypothetical protein
MIGDWFCKGVDKDISKTSVDDSVECVCPLLTRVPSFCSQLRRLCVYGLYPWKVFSNIMCIVIVLV